MESFLRPTTVLWGGEERVSRADPAESADGMLASTTMWHLVLHEELIVLLGRIAFLIGNCLRPGECSSVTANSGDG